MSGDTIVADNKMNMTNSALVHKPTMHSPMGWSQMHSQCSLGQSYCSPLPCGVGTWSTAQCMSLGQSYCSPLLCGVETWSTVQCMSLGQSYYSPLPCGVETWSTAQCMSLGQSYCSPLPCGVETWSTVQCVSLGQSYCSPLPCGVETWSTVQCMSLGQTELLLTPALRWRNLKYSSVRELQRLSSERRVSNSRTSGLQESHEMSG